MLCIISKHILQFIVLYSLQKSYCITFLFSTILTNTIKREMNMLRLIQLYVAN